VETSVLSAVAEIVVAQEVIAANVVVLEEIVVEVEEEQTAVETVATTNSHAATEA